MPTRSSGALLRQVYEDLEFNKGSLIPSATTPGRGTSGDQWRALGDWLMLASRMGAERVFFVGDEPVVLFTQLPRGSVEKDIVSAYRRAWCLARPQCLFVATEDELRVYALSTLPVRSLSEHLEPLEVVSRAADVADVLAQFHRDRFEAGTVFENDDRWRREKRADHQLLRDVSAATAALTEHGLERERAHELIERVILVRYLEDRSVITREYFDEVAAPREDWQAALAAEPEVPLLGPKSTFVACLNEKSLTYALFDRLAADFNGDLFLTSKGEQRQVTSEHLRLIQRMLTGAGQDSQSPLFLWAYDFAVVPTSLISSMYEQFYRAGTEDDSGTHYTPPELVEFLLSKTLTPDLLDSNPRVCDPACGSGIFLVEAFRLIVRHEMGARKRRITPRLLGRLLLSRLAGIDINAEAVRLAAFSLYLAYLNYQSPQDIRSAGPLPRLIHRPGDSPRGAVLVVADAFAPTATETSPALGDGTSLPWGSQSFEVVVGNPPWDEPKGGPRRFCDEWARRNDLPVGDRNTSQLFLWRALSFLRPGGVAAFLVGAPAFHNIRTSSKRFRQRWLQEVRVERVVNFTHARHVFFDAAVAPFLLIQFRHVDGSLEPKAVAYETVRPGPSLENTGSMAYARLDRRWVDQWSLQQRDYLWKAYAWGNHRDDALLSRLDAELKLSDVLPSDPKPGFGYQRGSASDPSPLLASLPSLKRFDVWGTLDEAEFEDPPRKVKRQPDERRYDGQRIVVASGIRAGFGPSARLEAAPFSFRHTIYCLPLQTVPAWQAKTILGVLLSSLGRYRLFMTSCSWAVWHDTFYAEDILALPIRFDRPRSEITRRIVRAVDRLPKAAPARSSAGLFETSSKRHDLAHVLRDLDEAVCDLFELELPERDLVEDFATYTLDYARRRSNSEALAPLPLQESSHGTIADLRDRADAPFSRYLSTFLQRWNRELAPDGEFTWQLIPADRVPVVAAVFRTTEGRGSNTAVDDATAWGSLLDRLGASLARSEGAAIRTQAVLRAVEDTSITIIKRNERRLWTPSAAREDADATMVQAMALRDQ